MPAGGKKPRLNLDDHKNFIIRSFQQKVSIFHICQQLHASFNITVERRTIQRRLKEWGVSQRRHTVDTPGLRARIQVLWNRNLDDKEILQVLQAEGYAIGQWALANLRLELGLKRRMSQVEQREKYSQPIFPELSSSEPPRNAFTLNLDPKARYIPNSNRKTGKSPNIAQQIFERFDGCELTDDMLHEAAQLFNENYGIWGEDPTNPESRPKPGSRVKLSKNRLRAQYLPGNASCSYVRVTIEDRLAGNAFACRWSHQDRTVCWVTQLVVHRDFRERGLATGLLNCLREDDDAIYGLMSSHPAACLAAAKAFGSGINTVAVDFIRDNAEAIMQLSPISYVKDAELRGSLFHPEDTSGAISSVDTQFFVDHAEPLQALSWVREELDWPLGDLSDGHEFLLMLMVRRRHHRSRPRSSTQPQA